MIYPVFDIQKAIYKRLTEGSRKIEYPVFDSVPDDQDSDYINFFNTTADYIDDKTGKDCPVWTVFFVFNCWTVYKGQKKPNEMIKAIVKSLTFTIEGNNYIPLTINNFNVNYIELSDSRIDEVQKKPDFRYKGTLTIELWVQEI